MNSIFTYKQQLIMRKTIVFFAILFNNISVLGQISPEKQKSEEEFYNATKKWFSAWELVSKDMYHVRKVRPVEFIFFDEKYVYSTSNTTITNGNPIKGCNLLNLKLNWKKAPHNGNITMPDKATIPIGLMSFAAEITQETNKSFFAMPLPSFWMKSGVFSKELGLENLITGVFIHEFSHSQQMQNFGKQIALYEKDNNFGNDFNDDIVQNIFKNNTSYVKIYNQEVNLFYSAIKNNLLDKTFLNKAFELMKLRQKEYFKGEYKELTNIDNFFLTMEGLGQYSMFLWLNHPKGGNLNKEIAIEGVRRNKNWWSQDEGFALFLVLDNLSKSKKWAKEMFGNNTVSVTSIIKSINK